MAKVGEDNVEYESDPEEEKRLLGMRRREAASDDEEGGVEEEEKLRVDRRGPIHSDESDDEGGAADYYDDEEDELDEEEEEAYDAEEEGYEEEEIDGNDEGGRNGVVEVEKVDEVNEVEVPGEDGQGDDGAGKKENEPFAVPTAGAFYMHDDRFRENADGRHRRTYGGRKLWESKDDKKWGHDKFEELNSQERNDLGRRGSRGRYQARGGKNRGPDRGFVKSNKPKAFSNGSNENPAPKGVRGRGPRKYEPRWKRSSQAPPAQNKQPEKFSEKTLHGSSGRVFTPASNLESDQLPPAARKNSSLSHASPPFYPSGSSNKDVALNQKRDTQAGSASRNFRPSAVDGSFSMQQANAFVRGKNIADSIGMEKLYIDDSVNSTVGKPLNSMQMQSSGSSLASTMQSSQSRSQGRSVAISGPMSYQSHPLQNQVNRVPSAAQSHLAQRDPAQNRISVQAPGQQMGQRSGSGSQSSSPPKTAVSINSYEPGDAETSSDSSKSRNALTAKGKGGSGRGSFMFGGAQLMGATGNMGVAHGDQNFPGAPTFVPVMQFGGQHPGVPTVGMAFPGYPQLGLGNSEMTWLPVLAGAAGALGATYCSPYITVDGSYHARPSGQTSAAGSSSKESSTNKSNNEWKPSQRPELVNDEFGQRQKPRRYSEMDFKQPSTST